MKKYLLYLFLLLICHQLRAQSVVSTAWGDGQSGITDQSISAAKSLAKDQNGNFYVAVASENIILRITANNDKTIYAGTGQAGFSGDQSMATMAQLHAPTSIYIAGNQLYIADQGNRRIRKVDLDTQIISTVAGDGSTSTTGQGLGGCTSVVVDSYQNIYVSTGGTHTVRKITPDGVHSTIIGNGVAGYNSTEDTGTNSLLHAPNALFLKDHYLYIADMGNRRIRKFDLNLQILSTVAGNGQQNLSPESLGGCTGVVVDAANNIYVSTGGSNKIAKITPLGIHSLFSGSANAEYSGDGTQPLLAGYNYIHGLFYSDNSLYVMDLGNYRIRKINQLSLIPSATKTLYVKKGSTGSGHSWDDAVGELSEALEWARQNQDQGIWSVDEPLKIWVAQGTYIPNYTLAGTSYTNLAEKTFVLSDNIKIYGGFTGGETNLNQRDWKANKTVLSGMLSSNHPQSSAQSYHVLLAINARATLDGFEVNDGYANAIGSIAHQSVNLKTNSGAGLYAVNATLNFNNLIFSQNKVTEYGGAVYLDQSQLSVSNTVFKDNLAQYAGGAIYHTSSSSSTSVNCLFYNNRINSELYGNTISAATSCQAFVYNSIVWKNSGGLGIFGGEVTTKSSIAPINNQENSHQIWNVNPLFTDAEAGDFSLNNLSRAINQGKNSYYTQYAWDINGKDLAGAARLIDSTIDLGPYEYQDLIPNLSITLDKNDVACFGWNNGSATPSVGGGVPPYSYLWSYEGEFTSAASALSNLAPGNYQLTVSDQRNFARESIEFAIDEPNFELSAIASQTQVSCYGGNNGTASIEVSGGTLPYTYSWTSSASTEAVVRELSAGEHTVRVTDAKGCTLDRTFVITQPQELTSTYAQRNISCPGIANGSFFASVSGGTYPYTFSWSSSPSTSSLATNLTEGEHTVIITDANQCRITKTFIITQPQPIAIEATVKNVSCYGGADGEITLSTSGGTPPYYYIWSTSQATTAASISGLSPGIHTVTVIDNMLCQSTASFTVTQPEALRGELLTTDVHCNGNTTGRATFTVEGGTPPYSYSWINANSTTETATNLAAGSYGVTVTDSKGCSISEAFTITEPTNMQVYPFSINISCHGNATGTALTSVSGGTPPYSYLWLPSGGIHSIATGLTAGEYTVTVTDANGCAVTQSVSVTQVEPVRVEVLTTPISCGSLSANGSASASVSGGTPPYTYNWSTGANTMSINDLAPGIYSVEITDSQGCSTSAEFEIRFEGNTTTWNGSNWTNGIPNSSLYQVIFEGDYSENGNLEACSVLINNGAAVTLKSGFALTLHSRIDIEAGSDLIIEDLANLIQYSEEANTGIATAISKSAPMKWLDHSIWSSPVSGQALFGFSPETVNKRIGTYKGAAGLVAESPTANAPLDAHSTFETGYGYMFRAPNTYYNALPNATVYTGVFKGVLNNGSIVVNTYQENYTSIGNPYPSAVNLQSFVDQYDASLYFYTNSYEAVNSTYSGNNFSTYNSTGAIASGDGVLPTAILEKGRGFVISVAQPTVVFDNSMRVHPVQLPFHKSQPVERHRFWLDLKNSDQTQGFNQILVGYLSGATKAYDPGKDAQLFGHEGSALYSMIEGQQTAWVIQGRALPFDREDVVKLGFKAAEKGSFTIALNNKDGLFAKHTEIILRDHSLGLEHNLVEQAYRFSSEAGSFTERFDVVYQSKKLSVQEPELKSADWIAYRKDGSIYVESTGFEIKLVEVYDLAGKRLYKSGALETRSHVLPLNFQTQVLIIKLQTLGNKTLYKKI